MAFQETMRAFRRGTLKNAAGRLVTNFNEAQKIAERRTEGRKGKGKENPKSPGTVFTKIIERGPNKGDRVQFRVGPSGHPYPIRVLHDKGSDSTLRDNGIPFGKKRS